MEEIMDPQTQKLHAALGPLAGLFDDPDVHDIMVDAPDRVLVDRNNRLENAGVTFSSEQAIQELIAALVALEGGQIKPGETVIQIYFPDRGTRGVAVLPPTVLQGPTLVIRKSMMARGITWEKLVEFGSVTQEAVDFIKQAVAAHVNILIAGGTFSGKTTIANLVAELISPEERLVVVEDQHNYQIHHPRAVFLEACRAEGVTINDLIRTGSNMRPDWLIVGELQGAEAMQVVEVFGRGYSGMTTIHANSLEDALMRLEAMCLTANMGLRLTEIRGLVAGALCLLCYQKYLPNGKRRIMEIAELRGVENGQYVLDRLFRYDPEQDLLAATGAKASWV
jgi:pilus assembly protein CpaF